MASRVCVKLLLNTTLRRERCLISALSRLSVRPYTVTTRCVPMLNCSWQEHKKIHYCTEPTKTQPKTTSSMETTSYVCRFQGLPWRTTKEDIEQFLKQANVEAKEIHFTYYVEGRFSGIVYVQLRSKEDQEVVLELDGKNIGDRYVSILLADEDELRMKTDPSCSNVVKLTGLPYRSSREEIKDFFRGLEILPNGVKILLNRDSLPTGIAFVRFSTPEMASKAVEMDGKVLGDRYVNIKKWTTVPRGGYTSRSKKLFG